jgi:light-regulated signal transduction histidine kinase (bacteriophytochrome)
LLFLHLYNVFWKFSSEFSEICVDVRVAVQDGKTGVLHVDVTDSGAGFESSAGARLFSPFVQLQRKKSIEGQKNQQGFGLGLAIARDIVESSLNGRVFGKSAGQGQGACFGFDVPVDLVEVREKKNSKDSHEYLVAAKPRTSNYQIGTSPREVPQGFFLWRQIISSVFLNLFSAKQKHS